MDIPRRKRIRLQEYSYSQCNAYFLTICSKNRANIFGRIDGKIMHLNPIGEIANMNIGKIGDHVDDVTVTNHVVMPNHIHILLMVNPPRQTVMTEERAPYAASLQERSKQIVPKAIQQYKASVSRQTQMPALWQSRYYDHILRSEQDYRRIWDYIETNPLTWDKDLFFEDDTLL